MHSKPEPNEAIEGFQRITEIILISSDRHHVLQRIHPEVDLDARDIEYGDFNWDGFMDFRIYDRQVSGNGCRIYHNYLFHADTQRYTPCAVLDKLYSVCFDDQEKTVQTFPRSGGSDYASGTYRWHGAHLFLISEVHYGHDQKMRFFMEYTDRRKDGTLRVRRFYNGRQGRNSTP
jgi:hypothetical protein